MKTIIINSPKDLKKHQDEYWIHIKWNCKINCSLWLDDLPKRLLVDWYLLIKAGESIEAGGSIEAGWSIEAGRYIEAGESIKAGDGNWISAWLSITCKWELNFWLKAFAGVCTWKITTDEEKTITCWKLVNWTIEYGILKETSIEEEKKIIIIDWKEIKISKEIYEELKKSLN